MYSNCIHACYKMKLLMANSTVQLKYLMLSIPNGSCLFTSHCFEMFKNYLKLYDNGLGNLVFIMIFDV